MHTYIHTEIQTEIQNNADIYGGILTYKHTGRQIYIKYIHTNIQPDRQRDRQSLGRHTYKDTYIQAYILTYIPDPYIHTYIQKMAYIRAHRTDRRG